MKLKRGTPLSVFPAHATSGSWDSADGNWGFYTLSPDFFFSDPEWVIEAAYAHQTDRSGYKQRKALLEQTGLHNAVFKSRREAVEALELLLADLALEETGS